MFTFLQLYPLYILGIPEDYHIDYFEGITF